MSEDAGRIVRKGRHRCVPPLMAFATDRAGTIWQCECGRRWKYKVPGNPYYEGWSMTPGSMLGLWRLRRG